ncbi:MAG: hypothetical protein HY515_02335 [Candidatus Aenigmarchaeota archaeon]|nr:hypothetical protein [Candidatus Aenigmarchaeota archaeon]
MIKLKGQIEAESAKPLFLAILAIVALAVIIAVAFSFQSISSGANIPNVCDVGGGAFDKAVCFPLRASTWLYGHTVGAFK